MASYRAVHTRAELSIIRKYSSPPNVSDTHLMKNKSGDIRAVKALDNYLAQSSHLQTREINTEMCLKFLQPMEEGRFVI